MQLTPVLVEGLGVALNEATLLGIEVDRASRRAAATLSVFTLPAEGPSPQDPRVQLLFSNVGRVAASLRLGSWDDATAPVQAFGLDDLLTTVQSFNGLPIYGWNFFDATKSTFPKYSDRLSLDVALAQSGRTNSVEFFQERSDRHLDFWLWFDDLELRTPEGAPIPFDDFIAGGRRWWDAFHQHDARTQGYGMFPLAAPPSNEELKPTAVPKQFG